MKLCNTVSNSNKNSDRLVPSLLINLTLMTQTPGASTSPTVGYLLSRYRTPMGPHAKRRKGHLSLLNCIARVFPHLPFLLPFGVKRSVFVTLLSPSFLWLRFSPVSAIIARGRGPFCGTVLGTPFAQTKML